MSPHRWRLVAVSMALTALAFVQDPGRIVNDTKIDLVLDPGAFLARALQLWDPDGTFGQVQNQAYGYLFPMGPFFWIGDLLNLPGWVVQRSWWALIFVVAFLGIVKLCGVLDLGSPTARIIGGLVFALSPRMLTVIGPSSIEVWPAAVAPWVLVPLVIGLRRGDPRRMALLSALAIVAVGGVNAVATAAVLPLGALLILLAVPGPRRRALMLWWPVATILATLWWSIPLLLLGRYSPPFLDYIESASTTTFAATPFDALRGTTNWLPYLDGTQAAGNQLLTEPVLVLNSFVLVALGLWGLARRDNPWRTWLLAGLGTGLVLVTLGHLGSNGWGAAGLQSLLDGALSPLRNTHKFDVVVRVPLVLGLVHGVSVLSRVVAPSRRNIGGVVLAGVALIGATAPAWTVELPRSGSFEAVPGYWDDTVDWLSANADEQNTLMLPGSAFGDYLWGRPRDEIIQAQGSTPWSVRNAVPLTPPGAIRTLDAFEDAFATGQGSRALTDLLQRSGIRYLLVRSDLDAPGSTDPELVYSTLSSTPGVTSVASFGPEIGSPASQDTGDQVVYVNGGLQSTHPAVEVFEVEGADATQARTEQIGKLPALAGSPGGTLVQDGLFDADTDVLLAQDVPSGTTPGRTVLTDTDRRQEVAFGRVPNNRSATLSRSDEYRIDRPVHDYVSVGQDRWKTVATLQGAKAIAASSSVSDVTQPTIDRSGSPWAAFDGDRTTAWTAGDLNGWIQVDYGRDVDLDGAFVRLPRGAGSRELTVRTDDGISTVTGVGGVDVPLGLTGSTRRVRIGIPEPSLTALSIAKIELPSAPMARPLTLPSVPRSWGNPTDVLLTADAGPATCRRVEGVTRCVAGRDGRGEDGSAIDRIVPLEAPAVFAGGVSALPVQSNALVDQLSSDIGLRVTSTASGDPAAGPLAMVDGDTQTGWIAALSDRTPGVTIDLGEETEVDRLVLRTDPQLAASAPGKVTLTFDDGSQQEAGVDLRGRLSFDPVETRTIAVRVDRAYVRSTLAFDGSGSGLPVGITDIEVPGTGIDPAAGASEVVDLPCGSGPTLKVGDRTYETSMRLSRRAVMVRADLPARVCAGNDIALQFGDNRVLLTPSDAFRPVSLRLAQGPDVEGTARSTPIKRSGDEALSTDLGASGADQVVVVPQTVNPGWSVDDAEAVTVNGWMQGWVTDDDTVDASFGAGPWYRVALVVGALMVLLVAFAAWRLPAVPVDGRSRPAHDRLRAAVLGVGVLAVAALLAGTWGLVFAAGGVALVRVLGSRRGEPIAGLAVVAGGVGYFLRPWNDPSGWAGAEQWPQWLVLLAFGVAVGVGFDGRLRTFLSRSDGRSITR